MHLCLCALTCAGVMLWESAGQLPWRRGHTCQGHNSCYATGSNDHSNIQSRPTAVLFSINWCRHVGSSAAASPTLPPWRQHINTGPTSMQQGCKFSVAAAPGGPIHGCMWSGRNIYLGSVSCNTEHSLIIACARIAPPWKLHRRTAHKWKREQWPQPGED